MLKNGVWLDYDARAEFIAELEEERDMLSALIQRGTAVSYDLDRLEIVLDELEVVKRIHRGERDVLYFGMEYASEDANPNNIDNLIPAGIGVANAADFHRELCSLLDEVVDGTVDTNIAWAVPRGHAKTAWLSNIFLLHQVVYRLRQYIVEISDTTDVAGDFIGWSRNQLKFNNKLREDFGELLYVRPSQNLTDNRNEFVTTSNTKVEAKGLGTQMRGLRHGSTRPDLFILDDVESKESTNTPELIQKSKDWFNQEAINALSKEGICIYLGTILVYDSLLDYVIRERKDFKSRKYAAVIEFAENTKLWETWLSIYREDDEASPERARAFFEENEEEMRKGAKVLWPDYWDYYELMRKRESAGPKAFAQEYQNQPTDEERQIFKEENIKYFNDTALEDKDLAYYAGIDIAMGNANKQGKKRGDFTVITTIAKNRATGVCYVVDAFIKRCKPDELLDKMVELTMEYQYTGIGIEAQFAQEFIADALKQRLREAGFPSNTRMKYIKQRTRKSLRIESLLPDIQNGRIRFSKNLPTEFMEQIIMYGTHPHDDAPDSTEMAFTTAKGGTAAIKSHNRMAGRWQAQRRR